MTVDEAIDTVARWAAKDLLDNLSWEDYPEIGSDDFDDVGERLRQLVTAPSGEEFREAYRLLEARAEGEEA